MERCRDPPLLETFTSQERENTGRGKVGSKFTSEEDGKSGTLLNSCIRDLNWCNDGHRLILLKESGKFPVLLSIDKHEEDETTGTLLNSCIRDSD